MFGRLVSFHALFVMIPFSLSFPLTMFGRGPKSLRSTGEWLGGGGGSKHLLASSTPSPFLSARSVAMLSLSR